MAISRYREQAQQYLSPLQVIVVIPLSVEAIVHTVNWTMEKLGGDTSHGLLKFDFANVFKHCIVEKNQVFAITFQALVVGWSICIPIKLLCILKTLKFLVLQVFNKVTP